MFLSILRWEMKPIGVKELREVQIGILDVVVDFCSRYDINYWLDCGTLLGAIRHKGYIPWDDDIDLGMLRPDFERFKELFNQENERYKFYCVENNSEFCYISGKVLDTATVLYEPSKEGGEKLSVNIDIFAYDNAPNDSKELERMFIKRDIFMRCNILRTLNHVPNGNKVRKVFVYFLRGLLSVFPRNYFAKKAVKNAKKYSAIETEKVGNFTSYSKVVCERSIFDSFIEKEFEGKYYKVPVGYDKWLRAFYKDYMQLPPEEKRVSHHKFEAYIND